MLPRALHLTASSVCTMLVVAFSCIAGTRAQPQDSAAQCFTRVEHFREPITGSWHVSDPESTPSAACPLLRAWEYCRERRQAKAQGALARTFVPNECQLSPVDLNEFLRIMDGRTLIFVGDSVSVQFAVAMGCMLHAQGAVLENLILDYKPMKALKKRCGNVPIASCHYDEGNWTVRSPADSPVQRRTRIVSCHVYTIGDTTPLRRCFANRKATDILVYGSVGVHFRETALTGDLRYRVKQDVRTGRLVGSSGEPLKPPAAPIAVALEATAVLETFRQLPRERKPYLIWREVAAQHFSTPGGHFVGGYDYNHFDESKTCSHHDADEMHTLQRMNPVANAIVEAHSVPVLRVWESTRDAHDAHVGFGDCTHFCSPNGVGEHWGTLLFNMLLRLQQDTAPLREQRTDGGGGASESPGLPLEPFSSTPNTTCFLPLNAVKGCRSLYHK